jgi:hypothetical protein
MKARELLLIVTILISALMMASCAATVSIIVPKTTPDEPLILKAPYVDHWPKKLIFLSMTEASCPTRCSDALTTDTLRSFVSYIEQKLMKQNFQLISGGIVSRIELELKNTNNSGREVWDRTEKALLLGKESGADGIFEVRRLHIDKKFHTYLRAGDEQIFKEVPVLWARKVLAEDRTASSFDLVYWEATVELRLLDIDGNVIWSGTKTVKTTDIIPEAWKADLKAFWPAAYVSWENNRAKENYDYYMYLQNQDLQEQQIYLIIDNLIQQLAAKP